jgi:hypothetical protein
MLSISWFLFLDGGVAMIRFKCSFKNGKNTEKWCAIILDIKNYHNHQEVMIIAQSIISIRFLIGQTLTGYFACFPDLKLGCHLSDYRDVFSNTNHLKKILSIKDSVTVANGIRKVAEFYGCLTDRENL